MHPGSRQELDPEPQRELVWAFGDWVGAFSLPGHWEEPGSRGLWTCIQREGDGSVE